MLDAMVLRGALSAFSTLFGSLGVFFLYHSFIQPDFISYSVLFFGIAIAIVWYCPAKFK